MSKNFRVIGYPLTHTMSPFIHSRLFSLSGIDADYRAAEIPPERLAAEYGNLRQLDGFNITIPHKQSIIPFLDRLDQSAARYGAVNTVKLDTAATGCNTDAFGFVKSLKEAGIPLGGKSLLCGCGGVARTMAYEMLLAGGDLSIAVRDADLVWAGTLKNELISSIPGASVSVGTLKDVSGNFDLLVNATPVGMYPHTDAMPVSRAQLSGCAAVFDAVYNPRKTLLLQEAELLGLKSVGGMPMLVWQAAEAHRIWYGADFAVSDIEELIDASYREMERTFHG